MSIFWGAMMGACLIASVLIAVTYNFLCRSLRRALHRRLDGHRGLISGAGFRRSMR
jgi:hypothetical protein